MKINTIKLIQKHLESGDIYFPDKLAVAEITLSKVEKLRILNNEYGIISKKERILNKYLKKLMNDLLILALTQATQNKIATMEELIDEKQTDSSRSD